MEKILRNFSEVLREWRKEHGVKRDVAAKELGVSAATWGHWEAKARFPSLENLVALSRYTKIPVQHFFCPYKDRCPFTGKKEA